MTQLCTQCGSDRFTKNGSYKGVQRYQCKLCRRYFSEQPRKFTYQQKAQAIGMYLNNVGIRKIARFLHCSSPLVVRWIKVFGKQVSAQLQNNANKAASQMPDIIEMDEILHIRKKNSKGQLYGLLIVGE